MKKIRYKRGTTIPAQFRKEFNLTQVELAMLLNCSQCQVSAIELKQRRAGLKFIKALVKLAKEKFRTSIVLQDMIEENIF